MRLCLIHRPPSITDRSPQMVPDVQRARAALRPPAPGHPIHAACARAAAEAFAGQAAAAGDALRVQVAAESAATPG